MAKYNFSKAQLLRASSNCYRLCPAQIIRSVYYFEFYFCVVWREEWLNDVLGILVINFKELLPITIWLPDQYETRNRANCFMILY